MSDEAARVMTDAETDAAERLAEKRLAEARACPADADVEAQVQESLRRPYRMEVRGDPEEGYLATAPELPGCMTAGGTPDEALRLLRDAMASWIEATILAGDPVPEPGEDRNNGRLLLWIPRSLHARLAEQARRGKVSTDQLAVTLLAEGSGQEFERLSGNLERALRISALPPGPEREFRRLLFEMTRVILSGDRWDPSQDAPGSMSVAAVNAYIRFMASLPPEIMDEVKRRIIEFPAHGPSSPGSRIDRLGNSR